ncbi:MAG: subtype B tannase [Dorea sp.]
MSGNMIFDKNKYTVETLEMDGKTLVYRAFENIPYVLRPVDADMQRLSIYVPEVYYDGKTIGNYNIENAPIFMPNTVGGYMPGPQERPGKNFMGETNASFYALLHGYVVVSCGVRGRGMTDADGRYTGNAPAAICDLKAAVRFLRSQAENMPGDVEKIISNGTSAGGALSSLLGITGNHPDYEPYLTAIGAAEEKDHIFASSCYCPITNLDHADMAYEWEFCGLNDYHGVRFEPPAPGSTKPTVIPVDGEMTLEQQKMSAELKAMFPAYVNGLKLVDEDGNALTLNEDGDGTFREYVMSYVRMSAQQELDKGTDLSGMDWMTIRDGQVTAVDFDGYVRFRTRMKETPAFDNTSMGTPENELFGTPDIQYRHFTEYSCRNSKVSGKLAEEQQIKMMNPMNYIEDEKADKAQHIRIRHGAIDRDTSLAISAMLTVKLKNNKIDAHLAYPWGKVHSGDYDLEELFTWIDEICG